MVTLTHQPVKGFKMQNSKKPVSATAQKAKVATLQNTGKPITYACIWAFINTHAKGQPQNVQVVPLNNVKLNTAQPVPFGYNGKSGGVRQTIQNALLYGVKGNNSMHAILTSAKPLGHSYKSPICLLAMLNGGYSPSSATWGTGYVKLVVQPQAS
jgi:hypothetical protein